MNPNPTTLRMPEKLREDVRKLAGIEHRSFSAQVVTLVEAGIAATKEDLRALPARERAVLAAQVRELDAREIVV